jgi:hypothetical protein
MAKAKDKQFDLGALLTLGQEVQAAGHTIPEAIEAAEVKLGMLRALRDVSGVKTAKQPRVRKPASTETAPPAAPGEQSESGNG